MNSIVIALCVAAAVGSIAVLARQFANFPATFRSLAAALRDCGETRDVHFVIRTLDVVPEGGTVVRGRFSEERRRPAPQASLPAAA